MGSHDHEQVFEHRRSAGDWLAQIWREHVRVTRRLLKTPAFTAVVALTLGLAIGGNAAIYSVVSGVLLKPLPYPDPDELVRVQARHPRFGEVPLTPLDFQACRESTRGLRRGRGVLPRGPRVPRICGAGEPRRAVRQRRLLRAPRRPRGPRPVRSTRATSSRSFRSGHPERPDLADAARCKSIDRRQLHQPVAPSVCRDRHHGARAGARRWAAAIASAWRDRRLLDSPEPQIRRTSIGQRVCSTPSRGSMQASPSNRPTPNSIGWRGTTSSAFLTPTRAGAPRRSHSSLTSSDRRGPCCSRSLARSAVSCSSPAPTSPALRSGGPIARTRSMPCVRRWGAAGTGRARDSGRVVGAGAPRRRARRSPRHRRVQALVDWRAASPAAAARDPRSPGACSCSASASRS